jgi:glycosyltransferase involved in cell wall biosynthesis
MRLLFVTHYFPPEVGAAQTRISDLAEALARRGHAVTVLTGMPNYPDGVIPKPYRGRLFADERLGDVRVLRAPVYPAPNRGVARRLLNHTSFALSSIAVSPRAGGPDAVIVETPPLFVAAAGVAIARSRRARLVLNVADLWPDAAIALGALTNRHAIAGARAIERFAYRHADLVTVPTPGLERVLVEDRGLPSERVLVTPHGVDTGRFPLEDQPPPVRRRVVYCGTIGMGHATGTLVEAARILEERGSPHEILLVGDGAEREALAERARAAGISSIAFVGRVPRERLPEILASAEVTVATQRDVAFLADALSTKVLESMAAARPVVGAVSGWTAEVIARSGAGVVCPPERPDALADAISRMTADPEQARRLGAAGRSYVEQHLTRAVAVERLEDALRRLVERRAT